MLHIYGGYTDASFVWHTQIPFDKEGVEILRGRSSHIFKVLEDELSAGY
jgi:hypothetical protein